jgi:PII-like signaling protein
VTPVLPSEGCLLRIFIGDGDRHEGRPLYEWLVLRARELGVAGATVLRGSMGYGAHSRLHTFKIERLAEDLPVVLEFVDSREKLERFLADVDAVVREGLATMEKAEVRFYRTGSGSA